MEDVCVYALADFFLAAFAGTALPPVDQWNNLKPLAGLCGQKLHRVHLNEESVKSKVKSNILLLIDTTLIFIIINYKCI